MIDDATFSFLAAKTIPLQKPVSLTSMFESPFLQPTSSSAHLR
jgi:hypothetical protein